jgi:hypothetical protein
MVAILIFTITKLFFIKLAHNAPQAAAVRDLADFIFAFHFHFSSHNPFPSRQTPH